MRLRELLEEANEEIKSDKINQARKKIKERVLEIEELKKALKKAKGNLDKLLDMDLEDLDVSCW